MVRNLNKHTVIKSNKNERDDLVALDGEPSLHLSVSQHCTEHFVKPGELHTGFFSQKSFEKQSLL